MRLLAIAAVFMGCTLIGIWIDKDKRKRIEELDKFIYAFELLKAEIDYRLTPLKEGCILVGEKTGHKGIKKVMDIFALKLEEKSSSRVDEMWNEAVKDAEDEFHLTKDDYKVIYQFGGACGYLDKNMEKRNLDMSIKMLADQSLSAKEQYLKTGKLNKSLGALIGLAISIFLL